MFEQTFTPPKEFQTCITIAYSACINAVEPLYYVKKENEGYAVQRNCPSATKLKNDTNMCFMPCPSNIINKKCILSSLTPSRSSSSHTGVAV